MLNLKKLHSILSILIIPLSMLSGIGFYKSWQGGYANSFFTVLDAMMPTIVILLIVSVILNLIIGRKMKVNNNFSTYLGILALFMGLVVTVFSAIAIYNWTHS